MSAQSQKTHMHTLLVQCFHSVFTDPIIRNAIIVIIVVAGVPNSILIVIFLPRVGEVGTVVLNNR